MNVTYQKRNGFPSRNVIFIYYKHVSKNIILFVHDYENTAKRQTALETIAQE